MGGWKASAVLAITYLLSEIGTYKIGGDLGSFLYVTMHFIAMPLVGIFVIGATVFRVLSTKTVTGKLLVFSSIVVPAAIVLFAFTGSTITMEMFGIDFNK